MIAALYLERKYIETTFNIDFRKFLGNNLKKDRKKLDIGISASSV